MKGTEMNYYFQYIAGSIVGIVISYVMLKAIDAVIDEYLGRLEKTMDNANNK